MVQFEQPEGTQQAQPLAPSFKKRKMDLDMESRLLKEAAASFQKRQEEGKFKVIGMADLGMPEAQTDQQNHGESQGNNSHDEQQSQILNTNLEGAFQTNKNEELPPSAKELETLENKYPWLKEDAEVGEDKHL